MAKEAKGESRGESVVSMSTMKTAVGDIDTMTIAPKGETEVDIGEADEGDQNGVQINDKVGARKEAPENDGGDGDTEGGEEENRNLSDDVGDKPKKKPYKATRDGRINVLTGKLRDSERTAEDYKRELEEERAKRTALAEEKRVSDYAAVMHYSDKLKADERELIRELKDAKDKADTEKEAEIQSKLSDVQGRKREAEAWVSNNKPPEVSKKEPAPAEAKTEAREQPRQKVTYQGEAARWVKENPWFADGSPDHDPDLAAYAKNFATTLEIRLKRAGNEKGIGSKEYFDLIDNHMRQAFPDAFGDGGDDGEEEEAPPPKGNGMAPVRSTGAAPAKGAQPSTNPNRVVLSQEQREVAHSLIMRHPNGTSLSAREKEIEYAKNLRLKKGA